MLLRKTVSLGALALAAFLSGWCAPARANSGGDAVALAETDLTNINAAGTTLSWIVPTITGSQSGSGSQLTYTLTDGSTYLDVGAYAQALDTTGSAHASILGGVLFTNNTNVNQTISYDEIQYIGDLAPHKPAGYFGVSNLVFVTHGGHADTDAASIWSDKYTKPGGTAFTQFTLGGPSSVDTAPGIRGGGSFSQQTPTDPAAALVSDVMHPGTTELILITSRASANLAPVPEAGSLVSFGACLAFGGLCALRRRRTA